jgi:Mrp family chromosome partitioning ATPase
MQDDRLLITDSAPLAVSAETEYLARSVDCAIVVIQSGVTTRRQLRATANVLSRLNVGSVGFLLNRIDLSTADAGFKNSIKDMEGHGGVYPLREDNLRKACHAN